MAGLVDVFGQFDHFRVVENVVKDISEIVDVEGWFEFFSCFWGKLFSQWFYFSYESYMLIF